MDFIVPNPTDSKRYLLPTEAKKVIDKNKFSLQKLLVHFPTAKDGSLDSVRDFFYY